MLVARALGTATATIKHTTLQGQKLLVVQPLRSQTLEPVIAVDRLGARKGDLVMISSDGRFARTVAGTTNTPIRWTVLGILEDEEAPTLAWVAR